MQGAGCDAGCRGLAVLHAGMLVLAAKLPMRDTHNETTSQQASSFR